MKTLLVGCSALGLLLGSGCGGASDAKKDGDELVDIFKDGAMQRIELKKLNKQVPAEQGKVLPGVPNADAIVGWYDSKHNFHKEKMDGKSLGDAVSNPALERGVAIQEKVQIYREGKDVAEIVAPDQVAALVANPGAIKADAIVGWYDSKHNFHKEKMDGKSLGEAVINEAAQKGVAIDGMEKAAVTPKIAPVQP